MILFVLFFSLYFYGANRRQDKNKEVLEGTVRIILILNVIEGSYHIGELPIYILVYWHLRRGCRQ